MPIFMPSIALPPLFSHSIINSKPRKYICQYQYLREFPLIAIHIQYTLSAPAFSSALQHSLSVAPVVFMSSHNKTVLPRTKSRALNASLRFVSLCAAPNVCWRCVSTFFINASGRYSRPSNSDISQASCSLGTYCLSLRSSFVTGTQHTKSKVSASHSRTTTCAIFSPKKDVRSCTPSNLY